VLGLCFLKELGVLTSEFFAYFDTLCSFKLVNLGSNSYTNFKHELSAFVQRKETRKTQSFSLTPWLLRDGSAWAMALCKRIALAGNEEGMFIRRFKLYFFLCNIFPFLKPILLSV
jgi:hypothetical protein